MTTKNEAAIVESAADEFAAKLKENLNVKEVIYLVAFEDETEDIRLAQGSTEEAPEGLRRVMLTEALKKRELQ